MPSLALPVSLAAPTVSALEPPSDYGTTVRRIFRGYLTGVGSIPYEIPLSAIECRRRLGEITWITVTCPNWSSTLLSDIAARLTAGGELVIFTGTENGAGIETLGLFLRASLSEYDYTRGPNGAEIQITGRTDTPSYTTTIRALSGIQNAQTIDGLRSVTCEIDPLLHPGDTATGHDDSFVVADMRYQIGGGNALMMITEDE
jgi:hypothetical protein